MDITMIGLQNAGKTSLLRVLAVRHPPLTPNPYRANADSSATNRAVNSLSSMSHYRAIEPFGVVAGSCDTPTTRPDGECWLTIVLPLQFHSDRWI